MSPLGKLRTDFDKMREEIVGVVVEASNLATDVVDELELHHVRAEKYKAALVATLISTGIRDAAVTKVVEEIEAEVAALGIGEMT